MSDQKDQVNNITNIDSDLPAATAALSAEDRADLVKAIKNKLHDLSMDHSVFLDKLPSNIRKRVDVLLEIQKQYDELEAQFFEERAALEAKFQKSYEPLYDKRCDIVNGMVEPRYGAVNKETKESPEDIGIPHFWLLAMKNNVVVAKEITERDEGPLEYLRDVKWSRLDGGKGFKLEFFFNTNPYFSNTVLTKTYHMISEDEHILENATGTEIEWFPGKNLTQKILKKKSKRGSNHTKPTVKIEDCESFFHFFDPPQLPEDEGEIDEETAELLQSEMEQDYEIGSTFREKIIPHAVSWFTGEAVPVDDEEDDSADEEEEEDYAEENDEEEDDNNEKENENEKNVTNTSEGEDSAETSKQ